MKQARGLSIPTGLEDLCDPDKSALLIYDMQVGVLGQIAGAEGVIDRCEAVLAAARRANMRVAYTRHQSNPKAWMGVTQYRTAMAWQRTDDPDAVKPWFPRGAPAAEVTPELAPTADDLVIDKVSMSAFEGTPLAFALNDCGIRTVVIVGVALEIGIAPTVLHATDLGFIPVVLSDACGFGDAVAGRRSLDAMRYVGEAVVSDADPFIARLGRQTLNR